MQDCYFRADHFAFALELQPPFANNLLKVLIRHHMHSSIHRLRESEAAEKTHTQEESQWKLTLRSAFNEAISMSSV